MSVPYSFYLFVNIFPEIEPIELSRSNSPSSLVTHSEDCL